MLQRSHETLQYTEDRQYLSKELHEYKKITANLKKKIKAKDRQISQLFSYIDKLSNSSPSGQEVSGIRNRNPSDISTSQKKQIVSEGRKKEKENLNLRVDNPQENNIFKQTSSRGLTKLSKDQIKLPYLDRKNLFKEDLTPEQHHLRQKVIKVPIEKLIPLKPEQLRQKFEQRFLHYPPPAQQTTQQTNT